MELTRFEMKIKEAKVGNNIFFRWNCPSGLKAGQWIHDDPALIGTDLKCPDLAG